MSGTLVIESAAAMRDAASQAKARGSLALVPTMGALHEGHLSLVRAAKLACDTVAVSIFVNPTQFGPTEDFHRYPRDLASDVAKLEHAGVDLVFAPSVEELYPSGAGTFVEVPGISDRLDGSTRPGHFRGVATIVAKLFNIVSPSLAFFGQKDAAQVAVLRAMVRDLDFPLEIVVCPTVREPDGLAMSSRNRYLTAADRARAAVLYRALLKAKEAISQAPDIPASHRAVLLHELQSEPAVRVEYAEIVDPDTLLPVENLSRGALLAVSAWIGSTRLIDNLLLAPVADPIGKQETETACASC